MTESSRPVRVRIAPSPTGDPHVGTAYIGQINELFALTHGGKLVLRIEDTDQTRSTSASELAIVESLKWFGMRWHEGPDVGGPHGPYRQSERKALYDEHAQMLMGRGGAYRCFCTAERLDAVRAQARESGGKVGYDGHCRGLDAQAVQARLDEGLPFVVRLAMPTEGETVFTDRLRGEIRFQNDLVDDQVLIKSDGMPTYHFANVVDDHLMEISHVIRAEEWINSTPKHIVLYAAFGWQPPEFIHMPLLRNQDKSKISKRKNPTSLNYYRQAGYLPEALRNFLALMGWMHPSGNEKFSFDEMAAAWKVDDMSLGGPVFDLTKLRWLNGLYIRELEQADLERRLQETVFNAAYIQAMMPLIQPRMESLEDFWAVADFFFQGDLSYEPANLVPKKRTPSETRKALKGLMERLEAATGEHWSAGILEEVMRAYCDEIEWKTKDLFMAVRWVVTNKQATPPLFESMEVLGKERVRRRFFLADGSLKTLG